MNRRRGIVIRRRRRGGDDSSALEQPDTSSLIVGYDFSGIDSTVAVTGQGISSITDSSGNGNTAVQGTDSRRPLYGSATINGQLAGDTDGSRFLEMPADIAGWTTDGMPPFSMLLVARMASFSANWNLVEFLNGGGAPRAAIRTSATGGSRFEARFPAAGPSVVTLLSTETTISGGVTYLVETYCDTASGGEELIVNEGTPATTTGAADSGEALPGRRVGSLAAPPDALYGALYIFNASLSGPERTEWRTFLQSRWGY